MNDLARYWVWVGKLTGSRDGGFPCKLFNVSQA